MENVCKLISTCIIYTVIIKNLLRGKSTYMEWKWDKYMVMDLQLFHQLVPLHRLNSEQSPKNQRFVYWMFCLQCKSNKIKNQSLIKFCKKYNVIKNVLMYWYVILYYQ